MADTDRGALVVGVDGSAGSNAALEWAVDEASRRRLPLHLVHATNVDYLVAAAMLNPATPPRRPTTWSRTPWRGS